MSHDIRHQSSNALELEFYIPAAVWNHPATQRLLARVYALVEGATLLGGARGAWKGEVEKTNLVRVVVRRDEVRSEQTLGTVRAAIDEAMRAWSNSPDTRQESFIFTVRELVLHEARLSAA
jgi:hypothetical protein